MFLPVDRAIQVAWAIICLTEMDKTPYKVFPPIGYQFSDFCPKHSKRVDHNLWSFLCMSLFVQILKRSLVGSVKPSRSQIALQVHVKSDMPSGFGGWDIGNLGC
jgi:hypothetical protein